MAAAFVHVLIPQTGRVELVHPATAEARGWEVVPADAAVASHELAEAGVSAADVAGGALSGSLALASGAQAEDDDDPQTSEPAAPQSDSATE
jgi:hypothetical protein